MKTIRWEPPEHFAIACKKCKTNTFISMIIGNMKDIAFLKHVFCPFCGVKMAVDDEKNN